MGLRLSMWTLELDVFSDGLDGRQAAGDCFFDLAVHHTVDYSHTPVV